MPSDSVTNTASSKFAKTTASSANLAAVTASAANIPVSTAPAEIVRAPFDASVASPDTATLSKESLPSWTRI